MSCIRTEQAMCRKLLLAYGILSMHASGTDEILLCMCRNLQTFEHD